jgi:hypothetical protein
MAECDAQRLPTLEQDASDDQRSFTDAHPDVS